ncbi:MAG TPA: aminopeptidase [Verrucomicrobiae bacterium]|nr:aminopeptidase [Verrucomicrobiae bacterium]
MTASGNRNKLRKWLLLAGLVVAGLGLSGCHTLGFYTQAVKGQYQIFAHQKPIDQLLASTNTPAVLKQRLELLGDLRAFAASELKLPTDDHYRKYVDVHRPFVVWNVEAAPELSMEPKTWWYPLLGSLEYRGYFSKAGATNYAAYLRSQGLDVSVGGVGAYSTLGWFKDPVLNTFIFEADADLAEIIFHELAHQRLFARGDTDFNEAFATTVGQEGARRWLKSRGNTPELTQYLTHLQHSDQFVHLVMRTRAQLQQLYGDELTAEGKVRASTKNKGVPIETVRKQKRQILDDMLSEFAKLKSGWGGDSEYDGWFTHPINNAHLNSVAAYYDFVPGFEQLLASNGGDMEKFYRAAEKISKRPKSDRHEELRVLARRWAAPARAQREQGGNHG